MFNSSYAGYNHSEFREIIHAVNVPLSIRNFNTKWFIYKERLLTILKSILTFSGQQPLVYATFLTLCNYFDIYPSILLVFLWLRVTSGPTPMKSLYILEK